MRAHLGSGSVYLRGWLNIDVDTPNTFLATQRPDLVEKYITDECDYYGRHKDKTQDSCREGALAQPYVCDMFGSWQCLGLPEATVSTLLSRQSFEHMSLSEARRALTGAYRALRRDGILRLDVPDIEASLDRLATTGDRFYIRHIVGPRRNDYGYHTQAYSRSGLTKLVEEHGFRFVEEEPNIHWYDAFTLQFRKCA